MKSFWFSFGTVILASLTLTLSGARIDNRTPQPGEIGYRPSDGEVTSLNPPSWIWLREPAAQSYAIEWSRRADFAEAESVTGLPFNTYTHSTPLEPGEWFWRYRFQNKEGQNSTWSQARLVVIPSSAAIFPRPAREEMRERILSGRPRLLIRPDDLARLRELALGEEAETFAKMLAQADGHIESGPTPEPEHLGSARDKENKEMIQYWWPNRVQTLRACQEAELLAFVYLVTREEKYRKAARKWILRLASWDPDGPTQFHLNCEAAKPLIYYLPRAYDWAWDALTPAERETVQAAVQRRGQDAWKSWEIAHGTGHLNRPYGSHANRLWHKLGECAIAFLDEIPEAELWLDYAVDKFFAAYPVWSDDDGGWHEGLNYMGSYIGRVVPWLMTAHSTLGIDGLQKPFFARVGNFPLYLAPPGAPNSGFADLAHNRPGGSWGNLLDYFLRASQARQNGADRSGRVAEAENIAVPAHWRWWMEQWKFSGQDGILGLLIRARYPDLPEMKPPADIPQSALFAGVGIASLHSNLLDSRDDVHFLFKSSPFGRQSHGHNPHNSFLLNAYGEALLTTCVYRDLHGSKFHYQWAHSTRAHNAVLVNQQEQARHTPAPHGRIVDFRATPEWDYVAGDATEAYGKLLAHYQRQVVFVKPDLIVIHDELIAHEPSTFQFMLHAESPFQIQTNQAALRLERSRAGLDVRYLSPVELSFRQWDGYEPPPEFRQFPTQWHVEAGTGEKMDSLGMLTVLAPYRNGSRQDWKAHREESDSAVGARFSRAGEQILIGFQKHGAPREAELAGWQFSGPIGVQRASERSE
jgi:hypothetical protein